MGLTADRDTPERRGNVRSFPVAAATKIYAGSLVVLDASGNAKPGVTANNVRGAGRARVQVDNTSGSAGDLSIEVEMGTFRFDNSASGDLIARSNIGASCYVVDDHTVALTSNSNARSVAGSVVDVDSIGVWVKFT